MTTGNPTTGYSGDVFTVKKVVITPDVAKVDQEIKITGAVDLFGIPFLGLVWITADITYPKAGIDLTNPIAHYETMGFGGKFTINIVKGFDRQGSFKVELLCYLGPTVKENLGVGGILTLPPFPNVAAWPVFNYTVSGVMTDWFTVGAPACPLKIVAGGKIHVVVPVTNTTTTDQTVTVTMQVKQQDKLLNITWNGALVDTLSAKVTIAAGKMLVVPFDYTETTDVGTRNLIIKVTAANKAIVGSGEFDSAYDVIAPQAPSLVISPSTIKVGDSLSFTLKGLTPNAIVKLTNQLSATVLYSFTTDAAGGYIGAFNFYGDAGSYTLVATDSSGKTASAIYTVQPVTTNYRLVISPSTIQYGGTVHFTVSGFPPYTPITFFSGIVHTDANGNGSGSFGTADPAGTYYLTDLSGYGLRAEYIIVGGPPTTPTLQLTNNNVVQGGTITFEVSNFTPHFNVTVSEPNGNSVTLLCNGAGAVGGVITSTEPTGNYTLTAKDTAGIQATASYTVVAPNPVSFKIGLYQPNELLIGPDGSLTFRSILLPGNLWGVLPPGYNAVVSYTCTYYDPVTKSFVGSGSYAVSTGVLFSNVHPGGYLAMTFSSNATTTPEIASETFTAQNGDVWSFNPLWAPYGWLGDMQKTGTSAIPTLTISTPSIAQGGTLYFTLSGFLPTEIVTLSIGNRTLYNITIDSSGNGQGDYTDNDAPGNYTLQAFGAVTGNAATALFKITAPSAYSVSWSVGSGSGSATLNKTAPFTYGEVVTITANPASGYSFLNFVINEQYCTTSPWTFTVIQDTTIAVNFQQGGGGGPTFPVPGTVGDGNYWYWVQYADGGIGWDDYFDVLYVTHPTIISGPYASGATS